MNNKKFLLLALPLLIIASCGETPTTSVTTGTVTTNPTTTVTTSTVEPTTSTSDVTTETTTTVDPTSITTEVTTLDPTTVTTETTTEPTTTTIIDQKITFNWSLKNAADGYVNEAEFYDNNVQITPTNKDNVFSYTVETKDLPKEIKVKTGKYLDTQFTLNTIQDLGEISLEYDYKEFAYSKYNSNLTFSSFAGHSRRSLDTLKFEFTSKYNRFFSSKNELHLYINTGKTSTKLTSGDYLFKLRQSDFIVYDFGFVHEYTDTSLFQYTFSNDESGTKLFFEIPYSYLGIKANEVIGVNYLEYIANSDFTVPMLFDDEIIDVNKTRLYERINARGDFFAATSNKENPTWISKAKKAELTKGKDYSFADPKYNAHAEADDVYFSIQYTKTMISFDFVGFGQFEDYEYFQLVIHNNIIDKNAWNLADDETIIHFYKDRIEIFYGVTFFFDIQEKGLKPQKTIQNLSYVDNVNHFTMNANIPVSDVRNIHTEYDDIYILMVEFGQNGVFYEGLNYSENFFYKGAACGDPADMISYRCIDAPSVKKCNLTEKEKAELIGDRNISFADPLEVNFVKADDMYMKITKSSAYFTLDIIGFGDFCDTEILTFVFHTAKIDGSEWGIQTSDTSLMIAQNQAGLVTGTTDYWVATRITRTQKATASKPVYNRNETKGYFTISQKINYTEVGARVTKSTDIRFYVLEFGFGGVIYNSAPWTKAMLKDGVYCGDPAFQKNYISIE